jgi:hypothetical protein
VVLAGVFPELRRRGYVPIHVRTLRDPSADLERRVRESVEVPADGEREALPSLLRRASAKAPLVIVLDQFEEFFIRFRDRRDVYDAFVQAMGEVLNEPGLRVHVVFSLREEYLADLDDFRANLPSLFENEYRLRPLTAFGVREAITRSLLTRGVAFDTRLVARLVDELSTMRFDSVMLQILCQEVFEHAQRRAAGTLRLTEADLRQSEKLTTADLQQAGDIDAIFRRYLDETTRDLPESEHLRARIVLRALMTQDRTKQAMRIEDFSKTIYRLEPDEVKSVLGALQGHRLLRMDVRGGEAWYELTHERLVPILEKWLQLDAQFNSLVAAHDLVVTPARGGVWREQCGNLLPAGFLSDMVGPFKERLVLTPDEVAFVLWSTI